MMKYRDLKRQVNMLTDRELEQPVLVYNPYYLRSFSVSYLDHIESFRSAQQVDNDPLALIIREGR